MKAALVTGAGKRIGRGLALALAEDGFAVAVHHNRSGAEAAGVVADIQSAGGSAVALSADLADTGATESLIARAVEAIGPLTLLVNNASRFALDRIDSLQAEGWDQHMAVNARAPALLSRDFARQVPVDGAGLIVNLLDQKLWNQNPDFLSYTISKVALRGLTEVMALALFPRVRVCAIAPGLTMKSEGQTEAQFARIHDTTPLGRGSTVGDIVAALRFLLSTPGINGKTLMADGGQHLQRSMRDVMFKG